MTHRATDDSVRGCTVGLLGVCLGIREASEPDAWTTSNSKSMLGGVLLGQKKYAKAEPLLRAGYEGAERAGKANPACEPGPPR